MQRLDPSILFSSRANFKTLEILVAHSEPVALRHIAYLANLPVFSIQRSLKKFLEEKLVTAKKDEKFKVFKLNERHASAALIQSIFSLIKSEAIRINAKASEGEKVEQTLKFSSDVFNLLGDTRA